MRDVIELITCNAVSGTSRPHDRVHCPADHLELRASIFSATNSQSSFFDSSGSPWLPDGFTNAIAQCRPDPTVTVTTHPVEVLYQSVQLGSVQAASVNQCHSCPNHVNSTHVR